MSVKVPNQFPICYKVILIAFYVADYIDKLLRTKSFIMHLLNDVAL